LRIAMNSMTDALGLHDYREIVTKALRGVGTMAVEEAMPRPYSADLRERVLAACGRREDGRAMITRRFAVGGSTLYGWLRQAREEGRRYAKPARGGRACLGGAAWQTAL
jgi:hypothetical protein